jgi:hypothetical protein
MTKSRNLQLEIKKRATRRKPLGFFRLIALELIEGARLRVIEAEKGVQPAR